MVSKIVDMESKTEKTVRLTVRVLPSRQERIMKLKRAMHIKTDSEFFNRIFSEWWEVEESKWRSFLAGE